MSKSPLLSGRMLLAVLVLMVALVAPATTASPAAAHSGSNGYIYVTLDAGRWGGTDGKISVRYGGGLYTILGPGDPGIWNATSFKAPLNSPWKVIYYFDMHTGTRYKCYPNTICLISNRHIQVYKVASS